MGHDNAASNARRIGWVIQKTGLSRPSIYRLCAEGKLPRPFKLSTRASAWDEGEVLAWLETKKSARVEA